MKYMLRNCVLVINGDYEFIFMLYCFKHIAMSLIIFVNSFGVIVGHPIGYCHVFTAVQLLRFMLHLPLLLLWLL